MSPQIHLGYTTWPAEAWYISPPDKRRKHGFIQVDTETLERWQRIEAEYQNMQEEMAAADALDNSRDSR